MDIANAIIHNTRERFTVNQKNNGAISNFDTDAVVEVPAYIGSMGAETISIGKIPTFHKGLMELQKAYEKRTVDAALSGSYQVALEAVVLNKTIPDYHVGKRFWMSYMRPIKNTGQNCTNVFEIKIKSLKD
ncbi:hypothetical protein SDC49_08915 [Lactobacillus sp. R2/2]|nr:hypothetical protein [Lactobacillus sp. R2/2]